MKNTNTAIIVALSNSEVIELISDVLMRDSCYSTVVAWDPEVEEIKAWHAGPENQMLTRDESLVRLGSFTFESPDTDAEFIEDYLRDIQLGMACTRLFEPEPDISEGAQPIDSIMQAIIDAGIKALAKHLSDDNKSDPEGIREAAAARWDENNRKCFVEQMVAEIIEELGGAGFTARIHMLEDDGSGKALDIATSEDFYFSSLPICEEDAKIICKAGRAAASLEGNSLRRLRSLETEETLVYQINGGLAALVITAR